MKPITFESIRNFLRAKKKNKKDGADASFKRSDSFKRISIRRSYLDRGRKRAYMRSGNAGAAASHGVSGPSMRAKGNGKQDVLQFAAEIEVENDGVLVGRFNGPGSGSANTAAAIDDILPNERAIDAEIEKQFCFKNKSLQEINELCGGGSPKDSSITKKRNKTDVLVEKRNTNRRSIEHSQHGFQRPSDQESKEMITSTGCFVKAGSKMKKPIGTSVAVTSEVTSNRYDDGSQQLDYRSIIDTEQHQSPKNHLSLSHSNVAAVELTGELRRSDASSMSVDAAYVNNPQGRRNTRAASTTVIVYRSDDDLTCKMQVNSDDRSNWNGSESSNKNSNKIKHSNQYLETSFDSGPAAAAQSKRNNVTRTTLNHELVTITNSMINSQTFKVAPSKVRTMAAATATIADKCNVVNATQCNACHSGASESGGVGGIVIRIPDSHTYVDNYSTISDPFADSSGQRANRSGGGDSRLTNDSSMERPTTAESPDDIETMDSTFRGLHLDRTEKLIHQNFYLEPELNEYDDVNIISPDSSIPYPLRIKTNPFTQQKEPYSVNLGRVWKQLNLGQDEPSLETSVAMHQTAIVVQPASVKVKNESFKSMSSRDSGFSLTLTKQKNIFDRKAVAPKKPRRKSKMTLNRDGYFKKVSVVQTQSHNSTRRKKKKKAKAASAATPSPQLLIRKLQQLQPPHPSITAINSMFDENFYETFSRYYKSRQKKKLYNGGGEPDDDDNGGEDGVNFSQEISDLEAFFEEHLKRLKDYYLQKKKLNEQTINELCHEYEQDHPANTEPPNADADQTVQQSIEHVELNNDEYMNEKYFMVANDTLKRKQKIKQKRKQLMKTASPSVNSKPPPATHPSEISTITTSYNDEFDYIFPHPDKRSSSSGNNSKKKTKFQTHEVRDFGQIPSDDTDRMSSLKYASLDFTDHMNSDRYHRTTVMIRDGNGAVTPPYAALAFPARDHNEFPYGHIKSKETNRRNKFKKSFESNSGGGSRRREYRLANRSTVSSEIYLSSIFPSIMDETNRRSSPAIEMQCKHCQHDFDEYTDIDDDDQVEGEDECDNLTSDEFSENEFIANSLGSELCLVCDKLHTECLCSLQSGGVRANESQPQHPPKKPIRKSKKLCYCDCTSGVYTSTLNSSAMPNKRKIKRIKSKRRVVGKNHSLRRDYCYYSSKYHNLLI